jgi:hypothetical protein
VGGKLGVGRRAVTRFVTVFLLYDRGFRGVGDVRK